MDYRKFTMMLLENNASDIITDEVVRILKKIFIDFYNTDDVMERNDIGMNSTDKERSRSFIPSLYEQDEDSVTLRNLYSMMNILSHYKNTQLSHVYPNLEIVVKGILEDRIGQVTAPDRKITVNHTNKKYGNVLVTFPEEIKKNSILSKQINLVLDNYFKLKGIPKEYDNYGNYKYPTFKYFSANRDSLGNREFYIKPELLKPIFEMVFPSIEVEEIGNTPINKEDDAPVTNQKNDPRLIQFIQTVKTPYGDRHEIILSSDFNKSRVIWSDAKNKKLTPKYINFEYNTKKIFISGKDEDYLKLKELFDSHEMDTIEIDSLYDLEKAKKAKDSPEVNKGLIFENLSKNSMSIGYIRNGNSDSSKQFLKELIQYVFYDFVWDDKIYKYIVKGDYAQYTIFRNILDKFKYTENVKDLDNIIKEKVKNGFLDDSSKEGELPKEIDEEIDENLNEMFPNSKFELYDLQKEGVKFLLSRKCAMLGSETGSGKTIQLIYAADLAYRKDDKPILIITLKSTQMQWVQEIIDVMGEQERTEISTDPMNVRKWTVLYYENFSAGKSLEERVYHLENQDFGVLILDELHKIKRETSKRSANISRIAVKTPVRWGASATISSNKPIDVKQQLQMLGHPLGLIPMGKFRKNFAGMVLGGPIQSKSKGSVISDDDDEYDDSGSSSTGVIKPYVDGSIEQRIKAAENLHRWLSLTGVYIRHSKSDMRMAKGEKMPDLKIQKVVTPINKQLLTKLTTSKISSYKDKDLEISKLLAFRESVAEVKVPRTIIETIKTIQDNEKDSSNNYSKSKVLIFTAFTTPGEMLHQTLASQLKQINPKWKVFTYLSSTPKNEIKNIKKLMEDKNSKVLVMSLKMGGTGISFPNTFSNMIINDYDFTPESIEQSEGRIYRINTTQDVNIKYIIAEGGDEDLYEKVQLKKQIAEIIQTYRKDYLDTLDGNELLSKITGYQKEMMKLDGDISNIAASSIGSTISESFKSFFQEFNNIKNILTYESR
jgi:5S rRNA maturation endonuclease (ribonuclease M5)